MAGFPHAVSHLFVSGRGLGFERTGDCVCPLGQLGFYRVALLPGGRLAIFRPCSFRPCMSLRLVRAGRSRTRSRIRLGPLLLWPQILDKLQESIDYKFECVVIPYSVVDSTM